MKSLIKRLIKKLGDMRRRLLYYRIWPAVYRRAAKRPIDEKKVLLASNSRTLPDNLSCMKRELESRGMHCTELLIPAGAGSLSGRAAEFRQNIRFQREYATSRARLCRGCVLSAVRQLSAKGHRGHSALARLRRIQKMGLFHRRPQVGRGQKEPRALSYPQHLYRRYRVGRECYSVLCRGVQLPRKHNKTSRRAEDGHIFRFEVRLISPRRNAQKIPQIGDQEDNPLRPRPSAAIRFSSPIWI